MRKQVITTEISKQKYINKLQSIRNMSVYDICRPDPAYLMFYLGKSRKKTRSVKKLFLYPDILIRTTYKWRLYQNNTFLFSGDNLPNETYDNLWVRLKDLFQGVNLKLLREIKVSESAESAELLFNDGYKLLVEQETKAGESTKLLDVTFYNFGRVYRKNKSFYIAKPKL